MHQRQALAELRRLATSIAHAHGATAEVVAPSEVSYPVLVNNPALLARILPSLKQAAGATNAREIPLSIDAEDFAFYAQEVPGVFFYVGAVPVDVDPATAPANHSPQFFVDEGALAVGTRALLQVSLDYLSGGTVR